MPQKSKGRSSSTERIHPFHPGRPYPFHTAKDDPFHLAWAPPRFGLGKIIEITGNEESLGEGHYVTIIMEDGSNVVGQVMSDVKVGDLVSGLKNELFRYAPVLPPGTVFAASDDLQPFGVHVASPSAGRAMMGGVEYYLDESGRLREAKEGKQSESSSSQRRFVHTTCSVRLYGKKSSPRIRPHDYSPSRAAQNHLNCRNTINLKVAR